MHGVWAATSLLFILAGASTRLLDRSSGLAVRFATGIVSAGALMYAESLIGIPWMRATLLVPLALLAVIGGVTHRSDSEAAATNARSFWTIGVVTLLATYGVATARETNADLLYFWGPKAQRFFLAQRIDVGFLKFPHYYLMHRDYPPLLPLVYAWSSTLTHRFSYWGATFLTPLYLLATMLAFRGFARLKIAEGTANAYATLLGALLAFGFACSHAAGGADAQLLMFEVIAVAALVFADAHTIAAIALAGTAFTKVEGAAFCAVVIVAYTILRRDWRRSLALAAPPAIVLGSWVLFAGHYDLLDSYARGRTTLHSAEVRAVLSVLAGEARYHTLYLPWIAAGAPLAFSRTWRAAALPFLTAAGAIAYTIFFYLHEADPAWWIRASAQRVLLTPLAALLIAAAATSELRPSSGSRGPAESDQDPTDARSGVVDGVGTGA